jgi:Uma2 family endonuclease
VVVVEVLFPSTESIDLADKLADYFKVASIQHYLIVRTRRREVIHHSRSGSEIVSRVINIGSIVLDPPGISIELADVYPATA